MEYRIFQNVLSFLCVDDVSIKLTTLKNFFNDLDWTYSVTLSTETSKNNEGYYLFEEFKNVIEKKIPALGKPTIEEKSYSYGKEVIWGHCYDTEKQINSINEMMKKMMKVPCVKNIDTEIKDWENSGYQWYDWTKKHSHTILISTQHMQIFYALVIKRKVNQWRVLNLGKRKRANEPHCEVHT